MIVRGEVVAVEKKQGLNPNATHVAKLKILEIYKVPETETQDMTVIEVYFDGTSRCGNHYLKTGETRDFIIRGVWAHGRTDQLQLDEPCKHQEILDEDLRVLRSSDEGIPELSP